MQRKIKRFTVFVCHILLIFFVLGCNAYKTPINTFITPVHVSLDLVNVIDDKIKVTVRISGFTNNTVRYNIPKIIPGTYQNSNYGTLVEDFEARDKDGNPLTIYKEGKNTWNIQNARNLHTISYWVNDTFDSESEYTVFSPAGTNIEKDKNFVLNLFAFIGYFENLKKKEYRVSITYPKELQASTSATKTIIGEENSVKKIASDFFIFKKYADVVDTPIMYTKPNIERFRVNDIEILLSVYSPNDIVKASILKPQLERIIRAQKNFLSNIKTTNKYSILLYLSSSRINDAKGFGALEHSNSTLVILPELLSLKKLKNYITNTVSHEFFHIITPINLHSEEIHNFDYINPQMSQHLWLYEGTTEYFSMLFQIREALVTKAEFFQMIKEKIESSKNYTDNLSFTEMSKNILKDPYRKEYRNVYEKGALISMCLDIIIREASQGKHGILDLVKELSMKFGSEMPFKDVELLSIIKKSSFPEVFPFLKKHVIGSVPIVYENYLKKAGVIFAPEEEPSSFFIHGQDRFIKGVEATSEIIFTENTFKNTFLKKVGVRSGDVLLEINKKKYDLKNIYDLFSDAKNWGIGDDIHFLIERNGKPILLTTQVSEPTYSKIILTQDPKASKEQIQILKSWIND